MADNDTLRLLLNEMKRHQWWRGQINQALENKKIPLNHFLLVTYLRY